MNKTTSKRKVLLFFGFTRLEDILKKGNGWYVRHYEQYFDEVYVVYLLGNEGETHSQGCSHLVSMGGDFGGKFFDLLLSPCRLLRFAHKIKPTSYFTADMVFSWWTSLLVRIFHGASVVVAPVCNPNSIYANSGKSVSGVLPIWLERLFIKLSFFSAHRIIAPTNYVLFLDWLESDIVARKKVRRVPALVEEFPSPEFYSLIEENSGVRKDEATNVLLYVGRLHPEKLSMDLIQMMGLLKDWGCRVRLEIIGDGQDRQLMEAKVNELGLSDRVVFHGALPNLELIPIYKRATVFVSTMTGTSLREAGLLGLPVVAYEIDWVSGLLEHKKTAFLARARDPEDLAKKVSCVLGDPSLRAKIGEAFCKEARHLWSMDTLSKSLRDTFEEDTRIPA